MRYLARRLLTGEWLHRDLPLTEVERTRTLNGPSVLQATIDPELRNHIHTDGRRLLDGWGTMLYVADDDAGGALRQAGIFIDASYEGPRLTTSVPGFSTYAQGYYFTTSRTWGPEVGTGTVAQPQVPRPDPLRIVQDHWKWLQEQTDSDLGVRIVGTLSSTARVGDYEEPYRLRWFESPDLGAEIDRLAGETPFDYVEEVAWANGDQTDDDLTIRLGWPRLGRVRDDLRFVEGENITAKTAVTTTGGAYANDIIGIGNGEGSAMATARATVRDGRLRRQRIVTDKTLKGTALSSLVRQVRERSANTLDITSVTIRDHPNARLAAIDLGDDITVDVEVESYGDVRLQVRVLSITETDGGDTAVLSTSRSSGFLYSPTVEVSGS